jgi:hypothetical protein
MKKIIQTVIFLLWPIGLMPLLYVQAQTAASPAPAQLPPGVALHIEATPQTGTVGDPIRILVDITMPKGYQVKPPSLDNSMGDFTILDFKPGSTEIEKTTGQLHHRMQITTAVYKTGKFTFPSLQIQLKTNESKEIKIAGTPIDIEIRSILTDKNPNLKDLKKQADIPEPIRWFLWIGLILAAAVIIFLILFLRKRKRQISVETIPVLLQDSLALAEEDLRKLIAAGLPTTGMEKQFYIRLSEIIKRILETGYQIPAIEQTTDEIMDALHSQSSLNTGDATLIAAFLISCDVVKFAKYIPSKSEQETAVQNALQILEQAKKQSAVGNEQPAVNGH